MLETKLNPHVEGFRTNADAMRALVVDLRDGITCIARDGGDDAHAKHLTRDKLLPHDHVQQLLDPGTPFLKFSQLVAYGIYDNAMPGAGIIAGISRISGQECVIVCDDTTVKDGTYYPMTVKKHLRVRGVAEQNHLPCVYLVDPDGASLPNQDDVFPDRDHFGRVFYNQAGLPSKGVPQIAVVMGSYTVDGVYVPAMNDESVIVKEQGTISLAGPLLVKTATGEVVNAEDLGDADVHTQLSDATDYFANNDSHALAQTRSIVAHLNRRKSEQVRIHTPVEPRFPAEELHGVIPTDTRRPFDVHEVIARIVDDSAFNEFKTHYGTTLICGFARTWGYPVGIIADNSTLFSEAALRNAHFIELCYQRKIPLVFLQDITDFMVGHKYENEGIIRNGAKMVTAVTTVQVPKFTIIIGDSLGAGNCGMYDRTYSPHFLWMWPNTRISVMGGEQVASVLATVCRDGIRAKGDQWSTDEEAAFKAPIRSQCEHQSHPYCASAHLWGDDVIDPADARSVLDLSLSASLNAPTGDMNFSVFRM